MSADQPIGGHEASEGNARGVGGPARGKRNGAQQSQRPLACAVVVHHPEFFRARARADKGDLRGGHAREAAGKLADDFVGELMREFAHLGVCGRAAIHLSDDGLRGNAANVKEPCLDSHFRGSLRQIAEADKIRICGRVDPGRVFQFGGDARRLGRIEAGTGHFENTAELKIVAHDLGEGSGVGFGGVGARCKIRDGHARFADVHPNRGAKPILRGRGAPAEAQKDQNQEGTEAPEFCLHPHLRHPNRM